MQLRASLRLQGTQVERVSAMLPHTGAPALAAAGAGLAVGHVGCGQLPPAVLTPLPRPADTHQPA